MSSRNASIPHREFAQSEAESRVVRLDKDMQRQFATTAFALGVTLRQIEDLFGVLPTAVHLFDGVFPQRLAADCGGSNQRIRQAIDPPRPPVCVDAVATSERLDAWDSSAPRSAIALAAHGGRCVAGDVLIDGFEDFGIDFGV